jgi:sugar phosphate permease
MAGWLSDRLIAAGAAPSRVRKTCTGAGMGGATIILAVAWVSNPVAAMVFLMLGCMSYGVYASSHWAITQTLAGPRAAGRWTGLQNFVGNLAGVAAPTITGFVVERTGQFFWAFAASAAVALIGSTMFVFVLGPVRPVVWRAHS